MNSPDQPVLSSILLVSRSYDLIRTTVLAISRQGIRSQIELIFVGPSREQMCIPEDELSGFAGVQQIEVGELDLSCDARAAAIRAARANIIVFHEDHCFPGPGWAEALVKRHQEPWSGVGPVFRNANPQTCTSWANLFIEYGEWMDPPQPGPPGHLPGHNSSYKRAALLEYGDSLDDIIESESPMQWDMMKRGHTFCLEPQAVVHHCNFSTWGASMRLRLLDGRLFAANRAARWSLAKRTLYALASPLIPWVRWLRCARHIYRVKPDKPLVPILAACLILLLVDGCGQFLGYAFGAEGIRRKVTDIEFNRARFMRRGEWDSVVRSVSTG